jgi:hypothetical protein
VLAMTFLTRLSYPCFNPICEDDLQWEGIFLFNREGRVTRKVSEELMGVSCPRNSSSQMVLSQWSKYPVFVNQRFNFGTRNSMRQKIRSGSQFGKDHWFLNLAPSSQRALATGEIRSLHQNYIIALLFSFAGRQAFWIEHCLSAAGLQLRSEARNNLCSLCTFSHQGSQDFTFGMHVVWVSGACR